MHPGVQRIHSSVRNRMGSNDVASGLAFYPVNFPAYTLPNNLSWHHVLLYSRLFYVDPSLSLSLSLSLPGG